MKPIHLKIDGLKQMTASGHLEKSLEAIPGVQSVEFDRQNEQAIVEHDGANPEELIAAAANEGLRATVV